MRFVCLLLHVYFFFSLPPDEQAKRRPDEMAIMKMGSQRLTPLQTIKEERDLPQADSTDDTSQDRSDLVATSSCHILNTKHDSKRINSQENSPIPSPSHCQFEGGFKAGGYGSVSCMSTGRESVYYPHHHPSAGRIGGSFLPSASPSPLLPSMSFSSQMAACRLSSQPPPDCSLRQPSSTSSPSSSGYGLRPGVGQGHHGNLSSCTYMQPPQHSYTPHHLAAANMHVMNMNFPGQLV